MKRKVTLGESYYNRHKIDVPIVKNIESGFLFFRTETLPFHEVVFIKQVKNSTNASGNYYNISRDIVEENKSNYSLKMVTSTKQEWDVSWDDFEEFLLNIKSKLSLSDYKITYESLDIILFAWEIFVRSNQSYLIDDCPLNDKNILQSIDFRKSIESRYLAYDNFLERYKNTKFAVNWSDFYNNTVFNWYLYDIAKFIR